MLERMLRVWLCAWLALLASCTVQLVPDYDPALATGLDAANTSALQLFAALDGGSPPEQFETYAADYATIIGQLDALRQRAETRPLPPLAERLGDARFLTEVCGAPAACLNASPASLGRAVTVLSTMQRAHRGNGLPADQVGLFKTDYETAMKQALFVEQALQR
jgi:hypothetical protein